MAHIRKGIDIVSHSDGKRYDSLSKYEKSLDQRGQHIMSDKDFRQLREKLRDEESSMKKERAPSTAFSHVHIDLNNDKVNVTPTERKEDLMRRIHEIERG
jgi:hypothetical protein